MSFKALRIISAIEVEIIFEGDDGTPVVHVFTTEPVVPNGPGTPEGILLVNGDDDFQKKYRLIGPNVPLWPEKLAAQAQRAAMQPFPAGETLRRLTDEIRSTRQAAWEAGKRGTAPA
jgi:hypothetical protein